MGGAPGAGKGPVGASAPRQPTATAAESSVATRLARPVAVGCERARETREEVRGAGTSGGMAGTAGTREVGRKFAATA
jgi:hypothetical protein